MERDNRMPEFSSVPNARLFATLCEMFFFGRSEKRHSYCSDLTNCGKKTELQEKTKCCGLEKILHKPQDLMSSLNSRWRRNRDEDGC